ncbi:MAG TPA: YihY/virulence factor BrkB family protein [Streptosporangiaceae bacterium]|jgi:YihY family inner membrane protein
MNRAEQLAHRLDRLQQRTPWLAFPVAVWKKFGDDQAGSLAALIGFYAFTALFPLLLVLVTVLDIVLRNYPSLRSDVLDTAYGHIPLIGDQLRHHLGGLDETGAALVFGLLLTFLGARGVAGAVQNALNTVWAVPFSRRPGFPWNQLRGIGLILGFGLGELITLLLSELAAGSGQPVAQVGAIVISLVLNIGLFWLGFRLGTARDISARELFPSALLSAIVWQILQWTGTYIIRHQLAHSSALYGTFSLVLGLVFWLFLQAQVTLYVVEASVVFERKLWPRSLVPPPLTPADRRVYKLYATAAQRRPDEEIDVDIKAGADTGGQPAKARGA